MPSKALLRGSFALVLLTSPAAAQTTLDRSVGSERSSLFTFYHQGNRLLATIDQKVLETDVLISAHAVAARRAVIDGEVSETAVTYISNLDAQLVSGALRLRPAGDSVTVSEYVGTAGNQAQYRRRAAVQIIRMLPDRALVIDAEPLWEVLEPNRVAAHAIDVPRAPHAAARSEDSVALPGWVPRSSDAVMIVQPLGGDLVTYEVETLLLPKEPMRRRLHDPRVPFYMKMLRSGDSASSKQAYITRHRLEKQDATALVSDVIEPIVARIDESVPEQWIPHFKQAIEDWKPVFESIGFRHAIKVLTPADTEPANPAGEVTFRWKESEDEGGTGNNTTDPRSAEILSARITINSGIVAGFQRLYFVYAGLSDPRARSSFPDSLTGQLLQFVVRHEFGHALGLDHNFQGHAYPTDSLRRATFVQRMGSSPSTMGYAWLNFVAQPEDRIPLAQLVTPIGPYDRWMIHWGYRPIPGATTSEEELPLLEQWRTAQDTVPYLRGSFAHLQAFDPYNRSAVLGDDLIKSVGYGIRNIARLAETAASGLTPEFRETLKSEWDNLLTQLIAVIGGSLPVAPYPRDVKAIQLQPIDSAYQLQALHVVLSRLFYGKDEFITQMLSAPTRDSIVVLFDNFTPKWEESRTNWKWPMERIQKQRLVDLIKRLPHLAKQDRPGVLGAACQAFLTLERRLSALPVNSLSPVMQEHVAELSSTVATAFDPGTGGCTKSP